MYLVTNQKKMAEIDEMDMSEEESTDSESIEENVNTSSVKEDCNIELKHMCAMNEHELEHKRVTMVNTEEKEFEWGIDGTKATPMINEDYIRNKTAEACTSLVSKLFGLPVEKSDLGVLVTLPKQTPLIKLPRQLPAPKPKPETKWEKFAKDRGITKDGKRNGKVFDEATDEWRYRRGPNKVTSELDYPIIEVKKNDDPMEDPWERLRAEKKQRVQKNSKLKRFYYFSFISINFVRV